MSESSILATNDAVRRLRFIIEVGNLFANSLDYEATLENIAALAVRAGLADLCLFHVVDERGRLQLVAVASEEPLLAERLRDHSNEATQRPQAAVIRGGAPYIAREIDERFIARETSGERAALMREAGYRSEIVVPVVVPNDRAVGALTLVRTMDPRPFSDDELELAEDIGRRAGLAYQNAHAYALQLKVATVMQQGALPRSLPAVPGGRFDATYVPASREMLVGGDWYDVFPLDNGLFGVTMGDVLGHGVDAAVIMGKLRHAMQAAAYIVAEPPLMLYAADRVLAANEPDVYATALAAIYDPALSVMRFSSAGHPGPLERTRSGAVRQHSAGGTMLGLEANRSTEMRSIPVADGSVLAFFTDGVVEHTRDIVEGYRRLHAALVGLSPQEEHPAAALVNVLIDGMPHDDVAVLTFVRDPKP